MVGGRLSSTNHANYLVISLAVAFVLYHLGQVLVGPILLAAQSLPQPAPVVQHQPTPAPTTDSVPSGMVAPTPVRILYGSQLDSARWPSRVTIAKANIDLSLIGSVERDGVWEIADDAANFAINSAVPNSLSGNTVLFGHDRPALFRHIHDLKRGDEIKVISDGITYVYAVTGNEVVEPTEVRVFEQSTTSTLTLITCDGWTSADRYIVHASYVRVDK